MPAGSSSSSSSSLVHHNAQLARRREEDANRRVLAQMRREAEAVVRSGAPDARLDVRRVAFMRYRGQGHEIEISLPGQALGEGDVPALRARLISGEIDVLTFTSPSTLRHFLSHLDAPARDAVSRCVIAAIGPVTRRALEREGLTPHVVPARADVDALAEALAAYMAARPDGG